VLGITITDNANMFSTSKNRNLIQGFVALATAAKEGLPLVPLWTLSAHPSITLFPSKHN
jgi:hypothetical protein